MTFSETRRAEAENLLASIGGKYVNQGQSVVLDVRPLLRALEDFAARIRRAALLEREWQPIETLKPKDGEVFIVGAQGEKSIIGFWSHRRQQWLKLGAPSPTVVWPTHWMPLPNPPGGDPR